MAIDTLTASDIAAGSRARLSQHDVQYLRGERCEVKSGATRFMRLEPMSDLVNEIKKLNSNEE